VPGLQAPAEFAATPATDAQASVVAVVHGLPALRMQTVQGRAAAFRLWNEYVARHHNLGCTPRSGSQFRYNVHAGDRLVALLSFGASAWALGDQAGRWRTLSEQRLQEHSVLPAGARR